MSLGSFYSSKETQASLLSSVLQKALSAVGIQGGKTLILCMKATGMRL